MIGHLRRKEYLRSAPLETSYDVVIIGGGGHGLAAYYLARHHGIRRVAVLERVHRLRRNRPQHDGAPRQLQDSGDHPVLQAVVRALRQPFASPQLQHAAFGARPALAGPLRGPAPNQRERALQNQHFGVDTAYLSAAEVREVCPQLDMTGGGKRPVLGAAYHPPGPRSARCRGVGLCDEASRLGVHVHQGIEVQGVVVRNGRCEGVETNKGRIAAGAVLSAVGGYVTQVADMAGIRLPIVTHPLQAFVTESYGPVLDRIVASADLHIYVSQTAREFWSARRSIRIPRTQPGRLFRFWRRARPGRWTFSPSWPSSASSGSGPASAT